MDALPAEILLEIGKNQSCGLCWHACDPEVCPRGHNWVPAGYDGEIQV